MGCNNNFDMQVDFCGFVPSNDHSKLKNRDRAEQHPIEAITGLKDKLEDLAKQAGGTATNLDSIVKSIVTNLYGKEEAEKNLAKVMNDVQDISDEILIPSGVYNIGHEDDGKIKLKSNKKITFAPDAVINYTAVDTEQEKYVLFDFTDCENTTVSGGTFVNDALGHVGTVFLLKDCERCRVEDVTIKNAEYGIKILADQKNTEFNTVSNCVINDIQYGIVLDATPEDQKENITFCRYNIIKDCQLTNPMINGKIQEDCTAVESIGKTGHDEQVTNLYNCCYNTSTLDIPVGFRVCNGVYPLMLQGCNYDMTDIETAVYAYEENPDTTFELLYNVFSDCNFIYNDYIVKISDYNNTNGDYKNLEFAYVSGDGLKFNIENEMYNFLNFSDNELRMILETDKDFYIGTDSDSQIGLTSEEVKIYRPIYFTDNYENKLKLSYSADEKHLTFLDKTLLFTEELLTASKTVKGIVQVGNNIDVTNGTISVKLGDKNNFGLLKVGNNIDVTNNVISVPMASSTVAGVLKVGTNIDLVNNIISVKTGGTANLGLLKVGSNINVDSNGVISLKYAAKDAYGIVTIGSGINVSANGQISVPTATTTSKGIIQIGTNITNKSGTISVATGSNTVLGLVKGGGNIDITNGVLTASKATTETLGTIKIGSGLKQTEDGTVSVDELKAATDTVLGGVKIGFTESERDYAIKLDTDNKAYVNVPWTDTKYNAASATNLGLVKIGTGIKVTADGTISADEIKAATTTVLGGIKAGNYIKVSSTGDVTLPIMTTAEITDLFNSAWYGTTN